MEPISNKYKVNRKLLPITKLICGLIVILFSCRNTNSSHSQINKKSDTLIDPYFSQKIYYEQSLNLPSITNQNDSFEVRIWKIYEMFTHRSVLIVKKCDDGWRSWNYHCYGKYIEDLSIAKNWDSLYSQVDSFKVSTVKPLIEYNQLKRKLLKLNFDNLPCQNKIPDFKIGHSDGITYLIESNINGKYNYYWYSCPDIYESKNKENARVVQILKQIHEAFPSFNYEGCKENTHTVW